MWLANSLRAVTPVIPQHRSACESGVNTELQQPREPGTSFHQPRRPAQGTSKFKFQDIPGFSEVDCSFRLQETNSSFLYLAPSHRRDLLPPDFYIAGYGIRDTGRQKDIDYPIPYAPQQRTPPGALARLLLTNWSKTIAAVLHSQHNNYKNCIATALTITDYIPISAANSSSRLFLQLSLRFLRGVERSTCT